MTLDEGITWFASLARTDEMCASISVTEQAREANRQSAEKHRQMVDWLRELKERRAKDEIRFSSRNEER